MKYKILICDDAEFMRTLIKDVLTKGGYEVIGEAANGQEAVEKYKSLRPHLVTMDIVMPIKSGIDALKEIIAYDANAKVVMCSALGQEILVMDAIEAGAKDFIVKPFTEENVLEVIGKVIESDI